MFAYLPGDPVVLTRDGQRHLGVIDSGFHTREDGTTYVVSSPEGTETWFQVSPNELQYDPKIREDQPNG